MSLAFALRRDFLWGRFAGYVIAQVAGATLACLFLLAVFGNVEHLGATLPGPGYHDWQALLMEIALTATLVSVILGTASAAQNVGTIGALGVGGYIALAGLWAAPVSGVVDEPGPFVRTRAGERLLEQLLGVRGRADGWGADRRWLRDRASRHRRGSDRPRGWFRQA